MRRTSRNKQSPKINGKPGAAADGTLRRIKIKDIASNCLVSQTTVRRWIEIGRLQALRLPSGHYRINQVDYRRFLEENGISNGKSAFESKS